MKIAVLRANALGDFIFILPSLRALRETYPNSEIVLLGKPWHKEFLVDRPSPVDRVVVVPGSIESLESGNRFFATMKEKKFDIAIQLHGGGRYSNPFIKNLGAKLTVGLKTADAVPLDRWIPYVYYQPEILRFLEVVSLVGAKTNNLEPEIEVTEKDLTEARNFLGEDERPFMVLHPGATDIRRQWPRENFAKIGDFFASKGFRIIVTGVLSEASLVEFVIDQMKFEAQNLCNKLSLGGLAGLLKLSSLVISNDTGPRHLAEAVGTPTVGIYWCGNLINAAPMTRSKHRPIGSWVVNCPLCGADCATAFPFEREETLCQHEVSFVSSVSVNEVIQASMELLDFKGVGVVRL